MKNFQYYRPTTAEQAVGLLENRWGNTELLGGGTDLHDLQKEYVAQPGRVVSLTGINALSGIRVDDKTATIGAGTRLSAIADHARLKELFPALTAAADQVGGPQIRNMGTLGGNLCQRNRCWYFRDEHVNCLLKGGSKCFALDGENQYHAVFTGGHKCVIVNPPTLAPALIALGAKAKVLGAKGERVIDLAKFFQAPSSANDRETVLAPNDLVLEVEIPDQGGVQHRASVGDSDPRSGPIRTSGPAGVDEPDSRSMALDLFGQDPGVVGGRQRQERRTEAGRERRRAVPDPLARQGRPQARRGRRHLLGLGCRARAQLLDVHGAHRRLDRGRLRRRDVVRGGSAVRAAARRRADARAEDARRGGVERRRGCLRERPPRAGRADHGVRPSRLPRRGPSCPRSPPNRPQARLTPRRGRRSVRGWRW